MLNRRARPITPPEMPELPSLKQNPNSVIPEITAISEKAKLAQREMFPKTIEDIVHLVNKFPQITIIKWLLFLDGFVELVLNSDGPNQKGYGGLCILEDEFKILQETLNNRVQFINISKKQ